MIRYWIEYKPGKGFRFGSQTTNPKAGLHWNKPKYSTYTEFAACMYLDEKSHVTWRGVGIYSSAEYAAEFVRLFPGQPFTQLRFWAGKKAEHYDALATGRIFLTLNGQKLEPSAHELEENKREAAAWLAIAQQLETREASHVESIPG